MSLVPNTIRANFGVGVGILERCPAADQDTGVARGRQQAGHRDGEGLRPRGGP